MYMDKPAVSVCITSYNHAQYLPETLDSVLSQDYDDFEIIVVDDGSTDNSPAILADYQRRYPAKVHCYWHPDRANKGISASFNLAARQSKGTYVAWLGSDDLWLPGKLSAQVRLMSGQPELGMVYSPAFILDGAGRQYPMLTIGGEYWEDTWHRLLVSNYICASTILIRRSCLDDVGLLDEKLVFSDWELWIRIAAKYQVGIVPQPLAMYRIHGQNISVSSDPQTRFNRRMAVIESVFPQLPQSEQKLQRLASGEAHFETGLDFFAAGKADEGRRHLMQALQALEPSWKDRHHRDLVEKVVAYTVYTLRTHGWDLRRCEEFVREVFSILAPQRKRKAVARLRALEILLNHSTGAFSEVRRYFLTTIILDPTWLRNGGFLSAGLDAYLGSRLAHLLRRMVRFVSRRARLE